MIDDEKQGIFKDEDRDALSRIISSRRDVRSRFLPDPVPDEVLQRVFAAAHRAPSVGLSQPWDFLVLTDLDIRRRVVDQVEDQRRRFAESLPGQRARQFDRLKIQGILDAPINVVVTSTLERGGVHVLGRYSQPETANYSTCLAIENLWLTARAEGLGVGWVSFYEPSELGVLLGIPEYALPIAYLCLGYVESFDKEPELSLKGWATPRPLEWAVHVGSWGNREARPFDEALESVLPLNHEVSLAAEEHHARLTKPKGALGELETIGIRLAAIGGNVIPSIPEPATVAVFAGDHGVIDAGVTPWPADVTRQMVYNFCSGGAGINAIARQVGAEVVVVDVGVIGDLDPARGLLRRKVAHGTRDFRFQAAMSREEALRALDVGAEVAREVVSSGARCLITGDMGIANTTPSAALIAYFTGRSVSEVTGRGTGIDDAMLEKKIEVIELALARTASDVPSDDPIGALASLGGLEIAALVGFIVGGAAARVPVIVDGVIAAAGLAVANALCPIAIDYCFAGHLSMEPGASAVLERLGMRPILNLDLRLGEGTGACLSLPIVQAAARILREMATFDQAGVVEK